jgi:hypothetical protein
MYSIYDVLVEFACFDLSDKDTKDLEGGHAGPQELVSVTKGREGGKGGKKRKRKRRRKKKKKNRWDLSHNCSW